MTLQSKIYLQSNSLTNDEKKHFKDFSFTYHGTNVTLNTWISSHIVFFSIKKR